MLSKKLYEQITGRRQKSNVIAYQIRQSFKPGEITAEEANKIGYELASRFLKGKHAFVVATHTDRAHIHNHIVFNSTALDHVCENAGKGYSSMYQDVKRCIPTEIDAINGAIVEQARRYNVSVPYNSLIVDLIHAIEGAYKYRKE